MTSSRQLAAVIKSSHRESYVLPQHLYLFFFNDTATTEIYTLSLHDALPIFGRGKLTPRSIRRIRDHIAAGISKASQRSQRQRSEEHTSELQSRRDLVCRLLLEKKKDKRRPHPDLILVVDVDSHCFQRESHTP